MASKDFSYSAGVGPHLSPQVSIALIRQDGTMTPRTRALVDSGCDVTSFPKDWASSLGIGWDDCEPFVGVTAAGKDEEDEAHKPRRWANGVDALIMGQKVHLEAVFRPGLPIVLLGREDFFACFKITFDQRNVTFRLERYHEDVAAVKATDSV